MSHSACHRGSTVAQRAAAQEQVTEPRLLGPITDYNGLVKALVARRKEKGLSQLALDDRAGLSDGYCGHIESWLATRKTGRCFGPVSLPLVLQALGCRIYIEMSD